MLIIKIAKRSRLSGIKANSIAIRLRVKIVKIDKK
jgi:hypothetical protein